MMESCRVVEVEIMEDSGVNVIDKEISVVDDWNCPFMAETETFEDDEGSITQGLPTPRCFESYKKDLHKPFACEHFRGIFEWNGPKLVMNEAERKTRIYAKCVYPLGG